MSFKNKTQIVGGDLSYIQDYSAVSGTVDALDGTNAPTVRTALDALSWVDAGIIGSFDYTHVLENEETVNALNCGQETFFTKFDRLTNMSATLLQNNDLDTLSAILDTYRETEVVTASVLTDEYMGYNMGSTALVPGAWRFISCAYQVDTDPDSLLWRRDTIYMTNLSLGGELVDQYFATGDTFEGIGFELNGNTGGLFLKLVARGATSADV